MEPLGTGRTPAASWMGMGGTQWWITRGRGDQDEAWGCRQVGLPPLPFPGRKKEGK